MWRYLPSFLLAALASAQTLAGVIDIHVHCDPDSTPRSIDALSLARLARQRGMRGLVLKNHYEPTASLAWAVRQEVPGLEVFGGIDLNRSVGGLNPAAVERMALTKGGWGRIVWMPTFDAENQVRYSRENRPFVAVARGGKLLPEVIQVMQVIARHHLVLETGHSSPEEGLMLVREARRMGIDRIVVTHALLPPVQMSVAQMREAAALGAYIEFVSNALIGTNKALAIGAYAATLRAVGPRHCILASDLGQVGNPLHPDGLVTFFRALAAHGFSPQEIATMSQNNPAHVLGLD